MGLAKTHSATLVGVEAQIVAVEANVGPGLPGTYIGGLADSAIKESVDRMKTAVQNSTLQWPKTKVIVNLTPASVRKTGSQLDLAMCIGILAASEKVSPPVLDHTVLLGEVGLDGGVRGVSGVLPALLAARAAGFRYAVVPSSNAVEASSVTGISVYVAETVSSVFDWVTGKPVLSTVDEYCALHSCFGEIGDSAGLPDVDMRDVVGQTEAKFAAEVAAAGGHHMMMIGPPGSGKSLIASRLPTILPALTVDEQLSTTAIHSVVGKAGSELITRPPFVSPHHSITKAALLGGGTVPAPGVVSLAHHGVLFLDEVSEISGQVLDSLRTPLEQGLVRIVRAARNVVFPARFQLVLAANPCKCGAEEVADCRCAAAVRARYLSNLSGPLRDRLDIFVRTRSKGPLLGDVDSESSSAIASRVAEARLRSAHRWADAGFGSVTNAAMNPHVLRREFAPDEDGMAYLSALLGNGDLSQRGVDRAIKLAWTLADLEGVATPSLDHVARAYDLRVELGSASDSAGSLSLVDDSSSFDDHGASGESVA